jgi:hypothetical protein
MRWGRLIPSLLKAWTSAVVACLLLPSATWGNIGPRWWGDLVAEPRGVKSVAITHEELTIDLRPLATVQPVRVEAVYHLNNPGPSIKLDLVFVSGVSEVNDFEVRLGDQRLDCKSLPWPEHAEHTGRLPANWKPPDSVPGFERPRAYYMVPTPAVPGTLRGMTLLAFSVDLPAGISTLTAKYRARAFGAEENAPLVTWGFPYVLAPAREWGDFGGLDVTAYVPEGWQAASAPSLDREGDVLRGSFAGLPADALSISVRARLLARFRIVAWGCVAAHVIALLSGGFLSWWAGRWRGRSLAQAADPDDGWTQLEPRIVFFAFLPALSWGALLCVAWSFTYFTIFASLAGQESPDFWFSFPFFLGLGNVLLVLLIVPSGWFIAWGTACRHRHPPDWQALGQGK